MPPPERNAVSSQEITNLIHRYAELMDRGDFTGVGQLFANASYGAGDAAVRGAEAVEAMMRGIVVTYDDGTPRTQHVTTNTIIEIDADAATARSCFTVFQNPPGGPIAVVVMGRYHDRFERRGAAWHFAERRVQVDHTADLSRHLRVDPFRGG